GPIDRTEPPPIVIADESYRWRGQLQGSCHPGMIRAHFGPRGPSIMTRPGHQPADCVTCKHCGQEFRAITYRHLRNIHGYDGDHPINDYKRRFRLHTTMCRDSRNKLSALKETYWARRGQHWTEATVLAEIRRLHRSGRKLRRMTVPVRVYEAGRR